MGLKADVRKALRAKIGSIPRGSMIFICDFDGELDHLEDRLIIQPEVKFVTVRVDTPEDDWFDVDVEFVEGKVAPHQLGAPSPHIGEKARARDDAVDNYGIELVEEAEAYCSDMLKHCFAVFDEHKPSNWRYRVKPGTKVTTSWSKRRRCSLGSRKGISIALAHIFKGSKDDPIGLGTVFKEYARIRKDPEIGEIHSDNWKVLLGALVAHEAGHVLQDSGYFLRGPCLRKDHGPGWQSIYRILRREWVNKMEPRWLDET